MKNILLLLQLFIIGSLSAQRLTAIESEHIGFDFGTNRSAKDTTYFLDFPSGNWVVKNHKVYGPNGYAGYLFGKNSFGDKAKAQVVMTNDDLHPKKDHFVKGIGFGTFKNGPGSTNSTVKFQVYELGIADGLPGKVLSETTLSFDDVKNMGITWAAFPIPPAIEANKSYAIGIDFSGLDPSDTISILTSSVNEFNLAGMSIEKWQSDAWYRLNNPIGSNKDLTALAYVAYEEAKFTYLEIDDAKAELVFNFPNPVKYLSTISYRINEPTSVVLEVYDPAGKLLEIVDQGVQPAGDNKLVLDCQHYNPGFYYYVLNAGKNKMPGKIAVVR